MEIIRHLTNEQLTDMLLEGDEPVLKATLCDLPRLAQAATDCGDAFWRKQQAEVREQISRLQQKSTWMKTLIWATAVVVLLATSLTLDHRSVTMQTKAKNDPDHELLVKIEQEMSANGPEALKPAAFLVQEISQASSPVPASQSQSEREEQQ